MRRSASHSPGDSGEVYGRQGQSSYRGERAYLQLIVLPGLDTDSHQNDRRAAAEPHADLTVLVARKSIVRTQLKVKAEAEKVNRLMGGVAAGDKVPDFTTNAQETGQPQVQSSAHIGNAGDSPIVP